MGSGEFSNRLWLRATREGFFRIEASLSWYSSVESRPLTSWLSKKLVRNSRTKTTGSVGSPTSESPVDVQEIGKSLGDLSLEPVNGLGAGVLFSFFRGVSRLASSYLASASLGDAPFCLLAVRGLVASHKALLQLFGA
jgi:hypothetical protein